jgi:transposase, IS5 family
MLRRNPSLEVGRVGATPVPVFGHRSHLGIARVRGLVRTWTVTHAAAHEGAQLGSPLDPADAAGVVWAGTA